MSPAFLGNPHPQLTRWLVIRLGFLSFFGTQTGDKQRHGGVTLPTTSNKNHWNIGLERRPPFFFLVGEVFVLGAVHCYFLLTAGLTTPWPNCNFCGLCWEWWRSFTSHTCWMLRNCLCLVIAPMLDATPVMGWVGWGGDDDVPWTCTHAGFYATVFVLSLHTCWMLHNCVCLVIAHMLDATQLRTCWMLCNCVWELAHWNHCDQTGNQLKRYIPRELRSRDQTTKTWQPSCGGTCLLVFVQNERAAELVWSTRRISPKSQQREKIVTKRRPFFGGWFQ